MSFSDALKVNTESVERPVTYPTGTYRFKITKPGVIADIKSEKGEWETLTFAVKAQEPKDDVNTTDLAHAGGIKGFSARVQFMFNKGSTEEDKAAFGKTMYQLTRFLTEHLGLGHGNLRELIDKAVGCEFLGTVSHRDDKNDKEIKYAEITRTAPIK